MKSLEQRLAHLSGLLSSRATIDEGLDEASELVSEFPESAAAREMFARFLALSRRREEAVIQLEIASMIDPTSLSVLRQRTENLVRLRRWDEAIEDAQRILRIEARAERQPYSDGARTFAALALEGKGEPRAALSMLSGVADDMRLWIGELVIVADLRERLLRRLVASH